MLVSLIAPYTTITTAKASNSLHLMAQSSYTNYKLAKNSAKLDKNNTGPKTTAAVVFYYAGVQNNRKYITKLSHNTQNLSINILDIDKAKKMGIKGNVPDGSSVLYQIKVDGLGTAYYTIANDNFYIVNKHKQFNKKSVSFSKMVDLVNKNNAGNVINKLASNANLNDNRGSSASTSSNTATDNQNNAGEQMSFDEAAQLIQKGGFTDFYYDEAKSFHDGSHPTSDGGYVMITYPGAKGEDQFTITKTGKNKYHIEAKYGSAEGGHFTAYDNTGDYGPSSADVTK